MERKQERQRDIGKDRGTEIENERKTLRERYLGWQNDGNGERDWETDGERKME